MEPSVINLPKGAENFIDELKRLKGEVENAMASDFQAIARLGFASGFESLTGGWQSDVLAQDVQKEIAHAVRRTEYGDMPFPKLRRIVNGGTPVGFVKLTLMDHDKAERYLKDHNQNKESQKLKEIEEHAMKLAEVERLKEAARQPLPFVGKLKPGIKVEGVITGNKEGIALAKFVIHDETIEVLMRGLSNPEIGSIVIASVPQLAGGKIKEVKFVGFKK
ncbi:MAG: hypothetical protein IPJ86_06045 [Bacteroidetes bacterium]|nr:hypothetical protein [Bacteroidota bacterium]